MTLIKIRTDEERQLAQYLLGQLSDEEVDHIDERSIAEDGVAWRLRHMEDELVDAYVSGRLRGEPLQRFKWFYLSSRRRRDKVRFAQSLLRVADRDAGVRFERRRSWPASRVSATRVAWVAGLAAALTLVGCGTLVQRAIRLKQELRQTRVENALVDRGTQALQQQLDDQRAISARAADELERARAMLAAAMDRESVDGAPVADRSWNRLAAVALVLAPQGRAAGPVPTLAITHETPAVNFQLQLKIDDYASYRITLVNPDDQSAIWHSTRLGSRSIGGRPMVPINLPASLLKPQHYALQVEGVSASGETEMVGSYTFRVYQI